MTQKLSKKSNHFIIDNALYILKDALKNYPFTIILAGLIAVISTVETLLYTYLPAVIVEGLEKSWDIYQIIIYAISITVCIAILSTILVRLKSSFTVYKSLCRQKFMIYVNDRTMKMPYRTLESAETQVKIEQVTDLVYADNDNIGINTVFNGIMNFVMTALGIISVIVLLSKIGWISLFVFVISIANTFINRLSKVYFQKNRDKWAKTERKISYINRRLTEKEYAMDIRTYHCEEWILNKLNAFINERGVWFKRVRDHDNLLGIIHIFVNLIYDAAVMGYTLLQVINGIISISDFVLYTGLIAQLSLFINRLFNSYNSMVGGSEDIKIIRSFLETDSEQKKEKTDLSAILRQNNVSIRFENVSYRYSDNGEDIIKNLNLEIKAGEKISLIGENGAGKSTLIKLLCGLYSPTEGHIYVNDTLLENYSTESISALFSVVFQEFVVLPLTIAENVSMNEQKKTNIKSVKECISKVGMEKQFTDLNVKLIKEASENGIDISGGQTQRLLIARAIYKDAPCFLLDEPTSALDPIIESEIYTKYDELIKGKTVIFVSHRLASTKFCDRILFLKNGKIVEQGSHDELLTLGQEYAKMYEVQAKNYR